jgi:hypothetical protein
VKEGENETIDFMTTASVYSYIGIDEEFRYGRYISYNPSKGFFGLF